MSYDNDYYKTIMNICQQKKKKNLKFFAEENKIILNQFTFSKNNDIICKDYKENPQKKQSRYIVKYYRENGKDENHLY